MEAVPKLPFIYFPLKISPETADFGTRLKQFIRNQFGEDHEAYSKEIRELEGMRQSACRVPRDFTGCSTLKKYYSQLHLLQKRFPMKENEAACVMFIWTDAYNSTITQGHADIKYEQSSILYNIGALHSELGAMDSRNTSEGMKMSCTHFQCAAWAFQSLRDGDFPSPTPDLSHSMLTFNINVMLGQAQECILEKSMLDNRKSTIVAKISAQIGEYYKQALKVLEDGGKSIESNTVASTVGTKLLKSWRKHLEFKIAYHSCITMLYMGNQADELQKMGERVAYLQGALDKLNEAAKLAKGLEKDVTDSITFTMDVVGGKLNAASKENEFVYHEKVPPLDSLPEVKGASLVKGIPFDPDDSEISGPDIFARLVPIEAHESSSMYSEEKAKLLRRISAKIYEKDEELKMYLSCLQLEQLRLMPEPERLPQELVDCCAAISVRPTAVKQLISNMQELAGKFHDVDSLLAEIKEDLEEENKREKEYQAMMGHRPTSMIILEISKELTKYQEAHEKAGESNVTLHKAMDYHITNLNLLSGSLDELSKSLPSVDGLGLSGSSLAKEFQRLLDKVDEMRNQRQMLDSLLREQLQTDDITKKLVTMDNQRFQELFVKELQKHDQQISYIDQNLAAQDNILKALTETNARFADSRKAMSEISQRREAMIRGLCSSYEAYEDLNMKSQKGLEFYRKLETSVSKLAQRLRSVCSVQEEERAAILKKQQPKKEVAEAPTVSIGPKLKDFLKFGNPKGLSVGGDYFKRNETPSPAGLSSVGLGTSGLYSDVNEAYVPQPYANYIQQPEIPSSNFNLPTLPSELRPPPVGSEKNDPVPCKANVQQSQPSSVPPLSGDYNIGYGGHNPQPMNQYNYYHSRTAATVPDSYAMANQQTYMGSYVPTATGTSSYANHSTWYQPPSSSAMTPISMSTNDKSNKLNLAPHSLPQQSHPYVVSTESTSGYTLPQANSTNQTTIGSMGAYNQVASYAPVTGAYPDYQVGSTSGTTVAYHSTPLTVTNAGVTGIYSSYGGQHMPVSHGTEYGTGQQQFGYKEQPTQYPTAYHLAPEAGYNTSTRTQSVYSQPQQPQYVDHFAANVSQPLQPQILHYQPLQPAEVPVPAQTSQKIADTNIVLNQTPTTGSSNVDLLKQLDVGSQFSDNVAYISKTTSDKVPKSTTVILKPKVLNVEDFIKQKDTSTNKEVQKGSTLKDPFTEGFLEKFVLEVERFQKTVEGLTKQSLNGPTPLEQKWKELLDAQDRESRKLSISVARCYSMKNRVPDIMPYDNNRVLLTSSHDDYINASYLKNLSKNTAQYIATQAPLVTTYKDMWSMIYEQQAEVVVVILSDAELRGDIYWPKEKGFTVDHGHLCVSLRNVNVKPWGIERVISITHRETKISRAVMHLQFTGWPPGGIPTSPALFLQFVGDVHTHFSEQRNSSRPMVIHCSAGVGRTGVFCLVSTAVHEINAGTGIMDLWTLAARMSQMRKYIMQDKEHMKFALHTLLYYAEECLLKRGILIKRASFDDKVSGVSVTKSHTRHPSQDFILTKTSDEPIGEIVTQPPATDEFNRSRSGSNASGVSLASSASGTVSTPPASNILPTLSPAHKPNGASGKISHLPPTLSNLDPDNFTLDLMPHKTNKITKESFLNPVAVGVKDRQPDPNDPLSQLDPLWNLHH